MNKRYTLYRYGPLHFAIDCEDCNTKVANLKPNVSGKELIIKVEDHDREYHNTGKD